MRVKKYFLMSHSAILELGLLMRFLFSYSAQSLYLSLRSALIVI